MSIEQWLIAAITLDNSAFQPASLSLSTICFFFHASIALRNVQCATSNLFTVQGSPILKTFQMMEINIWFNISIVYISYERSSFICPLIAWNFHWDCFLLSAKVFVKLFASKLLANLGFLSHKPWLLRIQEHSHRLDSLSFTNVRKQFDYTFHFYNGSPFNPVNSLIPV